MTKRLEELFELNSPLEDEPAEPELQTPPPGTTAQQLISPETQNAIDRVEAALPQVRGLESTDAELDQHKQSAEEAFNNLMDLGMQVDSRFSAEIFSVAASMKGHAINATIAKINKKLKTVDLQLKQAELQRKLAQAEANKPAQEVPLGQATVMDRNELLRMITQAKSGPKDK
jgi:hypothetical protein